MSRKRPYQDPIPFKDRPPDAVRHVSVTPSAAEARGPKGDPKELKALESRRADYRLVFQSMPLPGLPDELTIGRVNFMQIDGPVWSQRTHILQRPGWRPVYEKWMEHFPVGEGYRLTVGTLAVELDQNMSAKFIEWRDEVLAALSLLVALFDERLAQAELLEDVVAEGGRPDERVNVFDTRVRVREFTPMNRVLSADLEQLNSLASADTARQDPVLAAGRWYLRAVQAGPTPDAIVYFWIALEALSKPPWGTLKKSEKKRTDVWWVKQALDAAGLDPSQVVPDVGRLAGLRAEIVHGGVEAPSLLRDGYYTLEVLVRLLLRRKVGFWGSWPLQPGVPNVPTPLKALAALGHQHPKVVWRDGPPHRGGP